MISQREMDIMLLEAQDYVMRMFEDFERTFIGDRLENDNGEGLWQASDIGQSMETPGTQSQNNLEFQSTPSLEETTFPLPSREQQ